MIRIDFDNSYARLPERFFARCSPTPVPDPQLVCLNEPLARELGLDPAALASPEGVAMLAGNLLPRGAEPIAMAYAGHQFGNFVPQLGDGRAVLLGEIRDCCGLRRDLQLKGAGRTPFSRMGDGRAVLGPAIREYVVSEAMARLGVPTTRSLAVVTTGERILREAPKPGAVLARVAGSHVRVGTFQFFASRGDLEALRALADYVIERHYPQAAGGNRYGMLLEQVVARTAALIASWQLIGFIHGVMNTDNMSVAGETIDYGPCAFMDAYHPDTVYSSIDAHGRYAYGQQPYIAQWNLARLAQALLPLLAPQQPAALEIAQAAIDAFPSRFEAAYRAGLGAKLGLADPQPGDEVLAADLLARMADGGADFTLAFRRLAEALPGGAGPRAVRALFADPAAYDGWALQWHARLAGEPMTHLQRGAAMRAVNPVYIPRNHRLEAVISAAELRGDFQPLVTLLEVLASPFTERAGFAAFADPPRPEEIVHQTFCGT